jgi:hypothetical protein
MKKNVLSKQSKTDWARIDAMKDEDIDYSDIPPLTDDFFKVPHRGSVNPSPLGEGLYNTGHG